jgi:hypothetical protein
MALDYKIVNYKEKLKRNDIEYIDLLSKSFNDNIISDGTFVRVTPEYVARPDLISLAYYGDDSYGDILCKVNGISNPFELQAEMILYIPDIEYITTAAKHFDFRASDIVNEEDDEILLNKQSEFIKKPHEKRSSNNLLPGETNYVIDRSLGVIFY